MIVGVDDGVVKKGCAALDGRSLLTKDTRIGSFALFLRWENDEEEAAELQSSSSCLNNSFTSSNRSTSRIPVATDNACLLRAIISDRTDAIVVSDVVWMFLS